MIWSKKQLIYVIVIFLFFLVVTSRADEGWVVTAFIGCVLLIMLTAWMYGAITDPFEIEDEGFIIAVDISMPPKAWLKGDDEPLSTCAIIRLHSGEDLNLNQPASLLPKAARRQVFSPSSLIMMTPWTINLAIPDKEAKRLAMEQVKKDKYRFDLPEYVPITIQRSKKGRKRIVGT